MEITDQVFFFPKKLFKIFKGFRCKVATILPRGLQIWDCETKGHDIFTVYSKWKGDPPDPKLLTSATHPHFCYRGVRTHRKKPRKVKQYKK